MHWAIGPPFGTAYHDELGELHLVFARPLPVRLLGQVQEVSFGRYTFKVSYRQTYVGRRHEVRDGVMFFRLFWVCIFHVTHADPDFATLARPALEFGKDEEISFKMGDGMELNFCQAA